MGPSIQKTLFFFSILFLLITSSCSNNLTELKNSSVSVIFDYQDNESLPTAHLAAFIESSGNVRKCNGLRLTAKELNYQWSSDSVVKYQFNNRYFAGYTNFVMPENNEIPSGTYNLTYIEADGNELTNISYLKYDNLFYKTKAPDVISIVNNDSFNKKLAIYDAEQTLLYFGEINSEHKSNANIQNHYKGAETKRIIWVSKNNSVFCIMPPENLNAVNKKDE